MNKAKFSASVAMIAMLAGLGTAAMAQTAPEAPGPAAQGMPAPLPQALTALNLQNIEIETKRDGLREVEGRTADGIKIEAKIGIDGELLEVEADDGVLPQSLIDQIVPQAVRDHQAMALFAGIDEIKRRPGHIEIKGEQSNGEDIEARFDAQNNLVAIEVDDAALPASLIEAMLPQAVRDSQLLAQFGAIDEIKTRRGAFLIEGKDASGKDLRAALDAEGRVVRFGRGDDDRKGKRDMDRRGEMHGKDMRGHGTRGEGPRHSMRGEAGRGEAGRGEARRGAPGGPAVGRGMPAFDPVAAQQQLADAGYSAFGFLRSDGPRSLIEATNPQGEAVLLELDPAGELVRETAR